MGRVIAFSIVSLFLIQPSSQAAELAPITKHRVHPLYCDNGSTCSSNCNGNFCTLYRCEGGAWQSQGFCIVGSTCPPNACPTTLQRKK
jgi:hypothetical protein